MKKIIAWTLVWCVLFTSWAFASDLKLTSIDPIMSTTSIEMLDFEIPDIEIKKENLSNPVKELIKKYELVIRNNKIESDYKHNSVNYYTSKLNSSKLIVPEEIKKMAKKIYFLVEEGNNHVFYMNDENMLKGSIEVEDVETEYNYKIVDFKSGQSEYIFNNEDLIKDFWKWDYKNVTVTLIAEFSDTEKVSLSNSAYLDVNTKTNVLENLKNNQENEDNYFGYYNSSKLEEYLKKYSEKFTRSEYKNILTKAESKIKKSISSNETNKKKMLKSINKESDFTKYISKYKVYSESSNLLNSLKRAVKNQLQNIRAFDAIDSILK